MARLIDRLADAGRRRGDTWAGADEFSTALDILASEHEDENDPSDDRLAGVSNVFGLDETDADLLWSAASPDIDMNVGIAYGLLRGVTGIARISIGLALELAGVPSASADGWRRLSADGMLCWHRLLEIVGTEPWLARGLRAPDPVVASLLGADGTDAQVSAMRTAVFPLDVGASDEISRAITAGVPLVWINSARGSAGTSLAAGAISRLGLDWVAVDLRRVADGHSHTDGLAAAARAAGLAGRALIVIGSELLGDSVEPAAFEVLSRAAVPVIAVGARPWNPTWLAHFPFIVDAEPLPATTRAALWEHHTEGVPDGEQLRQALAVLRFTPEDIAETARYTQTLAAARDAPVDSTMVREAARRVGGARGSDIRHADAGSAAGDGPSFADLILPEHVLASLRRLAGWGRHRDEVSSHGALRRHGRGIAALFTGSPGTGKTLAAHVIAEELSVDLFQVELSAVVDKYIGETEKNLEKVFQTAEALDVVLFFDEADALFGSRSAVRDARDRYANQEIAYLLQRMEQFEGITILATNLRGNLDKAFARRMSFIVDFPDPDPEIRERLWQYHLSQLPDQDGKDRIDAGYLAQELELTGGEIRNIVLAAAYDALRLGESVGMRHIVDAAVDEYRKLGKVIPEHRFVGPRKR